MLSTTAFLASLLPFLATLAQAETQSIYSFAEGKSSPDGLKHGARGFECLKKLHGGDMEFLKEIENDDGVDEVTDEHIAAAIFMAYGEKGIDNVCKFTDKFGINDDDESTRRLLRSEPTRPQSNNKKATTTATHEISGGSTQRRAFAESACSGGAKARYPSRSDPAGIYSGFVTSRLQDLLPDGCSADCRLSAAKVVREAQIPLDEAEEGEYHSLLCRTWFNAFATLASVPDLMFVKQKPILDGINDLSCGLGIRAMQSVQGQIRSLMADGMNHNSRINEAEQAATYENSKILADSFCNMKSKVENMKSEIHNVKEMVTAP